MIKLLSAVFALGLVFSVQAADTPTERVQAGVKDIIDIATDAELDITQKREKLAGVINTHVDLQASAQRVLARYWRTATKEEKREFLKLFRSLLVNTYINLLDEYNDQVVAYKDEQIKKKVYAIVETEIQSPDVVIPVSYRLYYRDNDWKIYDFVAEGISMIRSFSNDYQSTLKSSGVSGLNKALEQKLQTLEAK